MESVIVKTRYEAEEKMKLGESFNAPSNLTPYNRAMLDFYAETHKYKRTKLKRGIDLYEPFILI